MKEQLNNNLEGLLDEAPKEQTSRKNSRTVRFLKNLAVNTSVKYGAYFVPMATMEYCSMNGDLDKVKNARLMALAVDTIGATLYKIIAKRMDKEIKHLNRKYGRHPEREIVKIRSAIRKTFGKEKLTPAEMRNTYRKIRTVKQFTSDAIAMNAVYAPLYYTALNLAGASPEQAKSALIKGAIIGTATSRPFRKFCLQPWRNYWDKKIDLS